MTAIGHRTCVVRRVIRGFHAKSRELRRQLHVVVETRRLLCCLSHSITILLRNDKYICRLALRNGRISANLHNKNGTMSGIIDDINYTMSKYLKII